MHISNKGLALVKTLKSCLNSTRLISSNLTGKTCAESQSRGARRRSISCWERTGPAFF